MTLIDNFLKSIFGSKTEKDIKKIQPIVEEINEIYEEMQSISNDELRGRTNYLKEQIAEYIEEENQEIASLKEKAENTEDMQEKENIYSNIDAIEDDIDEKLKDFLDELLPEAFAIMKETARRFVENEQIEVQATEFDRKLAVNRKHINIKGDKAIYQNSWIAGGNEITWDMIHYDVQLIGGVVLHQGKIAEMATGEGKTVVATLPVFLNALSGRGVHLVTVNNYLARRDKEWMGTLYEFHGLSVDCIDLHEPNSDERRKAYAADITFGTNNEFGFDYLRDNMAISPDDLVQRLHNYTIVDEVDSVLIDDARTPLIISGPIPKDKGNQLYEDLKPKVISLMNAQKRLVSQLIIEGKKLIKAGDTDKGSFLILRAFKGLPKSKILIKYLSEQGVKTMMQKTENVYLSENAKRMPEVYGEEKDKVGVFEYLEKNATNLNRVDENDFYGLYFVIDEKQNSVELTDKGIELISRDTKDPGFFVLPDIGTEIAKIEKEISDEEKQIATKDELLSDYAIKSERVHTINQLLKAYAMFEKDVDYVVMDNKVKIVDEQTGRILEGRRYSDGLHQAIEARENVKVEAATQTFATVTLQNYFRMYKKLAGMTGTAETEAGEFMDIYELDVVVIPTNRPIIREDRNDLIYKTVREKYNAVIAEVQELVDQGRPVLVGTTSVDVSELLSRMLKIRGIKHNVLNAKLHQREADIVAQAGKPRTVTIATNMAGRGTDIKLTKETVDAGGLAIVGTERHDSRRVDRQLRGRAGRQGDPGSSQFFVSLEDNLMRLFISDNISKVMDRMGLQDGEVIQHQMINKSIERAQKKVEENNFGMRKRLLEYDDVMNQQREVIYKRRRHALFGERLKLDIYNLMYDVCENLINEHYGISEFKDFNHELIRVLSIQAPVNEQEFIKLNPDEIAGKMYQKLTDTYNRKVADMALQAFPVIASVHKDRGKVYKNIVVPITDGTQVFPVVVDLKKAYDNEGKEVVSSYEKTIILRNIDEAWKEHLREMDELRQSVQNAAYEQKDPLLIYKLESFNLFKSMVDRINREVVSTLMKGKIHTQDPNEVREAQAPKKTDHSKLEAGRDDFLQEQAAQRTAASEAGRGDKKVQTYKRATKKVGRNEQCPCGSGKKYKHCCGKK